MADSTKRRKPGKPNTPSADFPNFPHQTGGWGKKVRGKLRFYGRCGRKVGPKVVPVVEVNGTASKNAVAAAVEHVPQAALRVWSHHREGTNFVMADGSVKMFSDHETQQPSGNSTRLEVFASRAGAESIDGKLVRVALGQSMQRHCGFERGS